MKAYIKAISLIGCFLLVSGQAIAQCYPGQPVTAAYADPATSDSPYAGKVLWLTWGATFAESQTSHPYGREKRTIDVGSKSYASIPLGGGSYLCIEAEVVGKSAIQRWGGIFPTYYDSTLESYIPGTYTGSNAGAGDFLDVLYNIGGKRDANNEVRNKMVSGIINKQSNGGAILTIQAKASIDGRPIRLAGLVVADGESLAPTEYIHANAKGEWTVVEVHKNTSQSSYEIRKEQEADGTKSIKFLRGNDRKTGAVAFLSFSEDAYDTSGANPDFSVAFTATLKGGGKTALALGLLTPQMDLGDAPESYGSPIHLIQNLALGGDGITVGGATVNVNTTSYNPGGLIPTVGSYLGTTPPDADTGAMHSKDAMGDDNSGSAGVNEEDAWPEEYKRFSYNIIEYSPGEAFNVTIPYRGGVVGDKISGWIDFNLNGVFDENERATATVNTAGDGSVVLSWIVPNDLEYRNTYVRLRYFYSNEDPTSPTNSVYHGEVEDHIIYILTPGGINPSLRSKAK